MRSSSDSLMSCSSRSPSLVPGGDDLAAQRIRAAPHRDVQRSTDAARRRRAELVVLERLEDGQDVVPAPALVAEPLQFVVVGPVPAVVDHAVDRARAAEYLAAGPELGSLVGPERRGGVAPHVLLVLHQQPRALGHVEHRMAVGAARLDQEHRGARVGRQPVGEHAARRSGAGDDVVVSGHLCLGSGSRSVTNARPTVSPKSTRRVPIASCIARSARLIARARALWYRQIAAAAATLRLSALPGIGMRTRRRPARRVRRPGRVPPNRTSTRSGAGRSASSRDVSPSRVVASTCRPAASAK